MLINVLIPIIFIGWVIIAYYTVKQERTISRFDYLIAVFALLLELLLVACFNWGIV